MNERPRRRRTTAHDAVAPEDDRCFSDADVERRKREWEDWRRREELEWRERMREKEEAAMRAVRDRADAKDKERADAAEASRQEYARLESRLKKALTKVETRERQLNFDESVKESERKRKQSESDAHFRILKEELKHKLELERTRLKAATERAEAAEQRTTEVQQQARKVEIEFQKYKEAHRRTPEAALQLEVASLKKSLAEAESRIQEERAERNKALFEKEQCRANLLKLVSERSVRANLVVDHEKRRGMFERVSWRGFTSLFFRSRFRSYSFVFAGQGVPTREGSFVGARSKGGGGDASGVRGQRAATGSGW